MKRYAGIENGGVGTFHGGLVHAGGRGVSQKTRYQIPVGLFCAKWSGKFSIQMFLTYICIYI